MPEITRQGPDDWFTRITKFVFGNIDGILFGDRGPYFIYDNGTNPRWRTEDKGTLADVRLADLGTDWRGHFSDVNFRKPRFVVNWHNYANRNITSRRLHSFGTYPSYIAINGKIMDTDTPYVLGACVTLRESSGQYYLILVTGHSGEDWVIRRTTVESAMANAPEWTTINTFNQAARMTNANFPGLAKESFVPIYFNPTGTEGKQVAMINDSFSSERWDQCRVAKLTIGIAVDIAFYEDFMQGTFTYDKIIDNDITIESTVMDTLDEGVGGDSVDAVIGGNSGPQKTNYNMPSTNWIIGIDYAPDGTEKQLTATMSMSLKVGEDDVSRPNKALEQAWIPDQNEPTPAQKAQWEQDIIDMVTPTDYFWWYFAHTSWTDIAGTISTVITENALQEIRITDGEGFEITEPDSGVAANYLRLQSVVKTTTYQQSTQAVESANAGTQPAPIFSFEFSPSSAGHPAIDPDPTLPANNEFENEEVYTAHKLDFMFVDLRIGFYVYRITKTESVVLESPNEYPTNPNVTQKWYVRFDDITTEVDPVNLPEETLDDDVDSESLNSSFLSLVNGRAFILQAVSDFLTLPEGTTVVNIDNAVSPGGDQDETTDPFLFIFDNSIFLPPLGATHPQGGAIYVHIYDSTITWINGDDVDTMLASIGTDNATAWNGHLAYVLRVDT